MEFDSATWTPLYRLVMGEPGQSHALETARRYGLPESVLQFARNLLGDAGTAFAGIIDELRQKRNALADELDRQQQERQRLDGLAMALKQQEADLVRLRQETIEKARQDARDTITAAPRDESVMDIQAGAQETEVKFRQKAEELEASFAPTGQQAPSADALQPGSIVQVRSLGREATVISIDQARHKVRVRAGSIEMEVPLHGLIIGTTTAAPKPRKNVPEINMKRQTEEAANDLNLIGKRVEEALIELEGFIDQAILAGQREIRIVHGIGTGTLQRAVREFLGRHPQVAAFRPGEPHEGRDGVTIAELA